ncbi:MAG: nucleoside-triphosphatase [Oscillospiraceae bacterium]|nr:nucleoside-triphosphatase [Oscillospiraceae bacterium]
MNVFLTGARGVGKSFALRAAVELLGLRAKGFATVFYRTETERALYIRPWDEEPLYVPERLAAVMREDGPVGNTDVFDGFGSLCLRNALRDGELIIMDELGFLEKDAAEFRKAVTEALLSDIPVLAVIRQGFPAWTREAAKTGTVITVDERNRDDVPQIAAEAIRR